jgi:histidinol-phosphate/aromatic aminotransferase/cobyric acid decarboxylase-like protein
VNRVAEAAALACLEVEGYVERERGRMDALRPRFAADLGALGLRVAPSAANFLLCRLPEGTGADLLYEGLARDGFLVRHCGSFGLGERYVRLRVHTRVANRALLAALAPRLSRRPALAARAAGARRTGARMRP